MSRPVIVVDSLSKSYRLGVKGHVRPSFRESMVQAVRSPIRRWRETDASKGKLFWALKDVSFEVKAGEVLGLIGRNGAGKSTLLKVLSRITEPTHGSARIRGRLASLLEVGTGFHPELTGRENVYLNGSILGMHKYEIDRKFDEIVAFAEIEQFLDTQVKHYSSGMYVRLAFAVAAHLEPQILIIDEVLAVGDMAFQKKCLGRMEDVTREGRTVLFVSHNVPAIQNLCTRCILLENGTLTMDGDTEAVLDAYSRSTIVRTQMEEDLTNHPGRTSAYEPHMKRVRVSGLGDDPETISMGDGIQIEVTFEAPRALHHVTCSIQVKTIRGVPVFAVDTDANPPEPIEGTIQEGRFTCRIDRIPLMAGTYSLDLHFGSRNMINLDIIHDACRFEVNPSDVFGTGKLPHPNSGNIYWNANWELNADLTSASTAL